MFAASVARRVVEVVPVQRREVGLSVLGWQVDLVGAAALQLRQGLPVVHTHVVVLFVLALSPLKVALPDLSPVATAAA